MNIGIDIGSTAAKAVVVDKGGREILHTFLMPTGWSGTKAAEEIKENLQNAGFFVEGAHVVATGYGRVSIPYADKAVTEITCHGQGVFHLFQRDCTVIDIGGQDTKVITLQEGAVQDFLMNDKCSAGTGRFLEIMATTLGIDLAELFALAENGTDITISSMCTVFAESEVISLIGKGCRKEDIAAAICESIVTKVVSMCNKQGAGKVYYLSGGLCESAYLRRRLCEKLGAEVFSEPMARYAGALGAAILASRIKD
ncbi:acyl-CoA dehydratase activase [Ruminococcaceae bacterium OttesenSCG-928-I18]|nr:acyl-CoA dehydratase activase [Ruminococcaceae bacterium OttesenSCG-928-I18]